MWAIQKEIYNYIEELEKEQTIKRKEGIDIKVKKLKDNKGDYLVIAQQIKLFLNTKFPNYVLCIGINLVKK
jgi:hypothetical protein